MEKIKAYLDSILSSMAKLPPEEVGHAIAALQWARMNDKQVFIMGNSGSAATASDFACDLAKGTLIRQTSLSRNSSHRQHATFFPLWPMTSGTSMYLVSSWPASCAREMWW